MVLITDLNPQVIEIVRKLILNDDALQDYMTKFNEEIEKGLAKETCDSTSVKSIVTYVNKLPTGDEEGNFIALEFGSPTIRILLVSMIQRECTVTSKMYDIPEKLMSGRSRRLFDFLAKCISDFLKGLKLKMLRVPLGFTFGFPTEQRTLQDCRLIRWTKGFHCDDLIGQDVCSKLKDAIRNYPELKRIYIVGVLNDTVSTVLACAWQDPNCKVGVVLGPGANCCYAERASKVEKYEPSTTVKNVYINLESGAFGEDGSLDNMRSSFDFQLDEGSDSPGEQINEKMMSTMYLGELTRLCLVTCIKGNVVLNGVLKDKLNTSWAFQTEHMSRIESDPEQLHRECRAVLEEFDYKQVSDTDCVQIQFICRCVSRRCANLIAAQLAILLKRVDEEEITIAADGQMIKEYPNFEWYMRKKLRQLKKSKIAILKTEENGLGRGAAVMAAIFGQEVMDREEKLRRLPGFPMENCHFKKKGKCLNPDCNQNSSDAENCAASEATKAPSQDLLASCMPQDKKKKTNPCEAYDRVPS